MNWHKVPDDRVLTLQKRTDERNPGGISLVIHGKQFARHLFSYKLFACDNCSRANCTHIFFFLIKLLSRICIPMYIYIYI